MWKLESNVYKINMSQYNNNINFNKKSNEDFSNLESMSSNTCEIIRREIEVKIITTRPNFRNGSVKTISIDIESLKF